MLLFLLYKAINILIKNIDCSFFLDFILEEFYNNYKE